MLKREAARRALGEFTVIVLGVLVAFQVDSWAESKRSLVRERSQLEALTADFEENRRRLLGNIRSQERHLLGIGGVLSIINGDIEAPEQDSLNYLVAISQMYQRFEPVTGAYDALLASGDIGILSSQELRAQLAGFYSQARGGHEDEHLSDLCHLELYRIIAKRIPIYRATPEAVRRRTGFTGTVEPIDWGVLLEDQEYAGILAYVGVLESTQLAYFRRLETQIAEILELLETQLPNP